MPKHMPGSSIERANSLSRHSDWQMEVKRNNKDRILVKKEWLEIRVMQVTEVVIKGIDLLKKIRKPETKDNRIVKAIEEMK